MEESACLSERVHHHTIAQGDFMKYTILFLAFLFVSCSSSPWRFTVPPSTPVITQNVVVQKKQPILFVLHDNDGGWRFLANEWSLLDPAVEVSIRDLMHIDCTITDVAYLKKGWKAWRADKYSPWNSAEYK